VGDYNYQRFDLYVESGEDEREFGAFPNSLHAGKRARAAHPRAAS
jgi:hypothetical protein